MRKADDRLKEINHAYDTLQEHQPPISLDANIEEMPLQKMMEYTSAVINEGANREEPLSERTQLNLGSRKDVINAASHKLFPVSLDN
jgi:hypothetical protein